MAKRDRSMTARKINSWISQGRGQGTGSDYKPWLETQNVPSEGTVSRIKGWKTGRVHHLMSGLERKYFYLLEWSPKVIDICEQFPLLPLERTMEIAEHAGFKHPSDPTSKEPTVMTSDFWVVVKDENEVRPIVRTLKPHSKLGRRELQKFYIEHSFYREQGIDWGIVTDQDIPSNLVKNIEFIHGFYHLDSFTDITTDTILKISPSLFSAINSSGVSLSKIAMHQDTVYGVPPGSCLALIKHFIARRIWTTDMNVDLSTSRNIVIQRTNNYPN